jgi:hypothetical protein
MQRIEIIRLLKELEEKFPVDEWIIDGVHIWPIVRIKLFLRANSISAYKGKIDYSKDFLKKIWLHSLIILKGLPQYIFAYIVDHKHNKKPTDPTYALFLSDGLSFDLIQDEWYDRHCDPLIQKFKENGKTSCILTLGHRYKIPRFSSSMFIQPYLDVIKIKAFIFNHNNDSFEKRLAGYDEMVGFLKKKSLSFDPPDIKDLNRSVGEIRLLSGYLKKIMKSAKPKVAIFSSYYDMAGWALNLACRDLGILSVDIQHGFQGNGHPAYSSWNKIPENGYELLPSIFWSWSDYEAQTINKWCAKVKNLHQPIVGGNLWLDFWKSEGNRMIMTYDKKIKDIKRLNSNPIHVLVTLQTYYTENLLHLLMPVMKKTSANIFWWFREQLTFDEGTPDVDVEMILRENNISNYTIKEPTKFPLGVLLRNLDINLTVNSSTVIDAERFSVPSIATFEEANIVFPDQFENGIAVHAQTPEDIEKAIYFQLKKWKNKIDTDDKQIIKKQSDGMKKLLDLIASNGIREP